ncbi:MAG: TolB family protein [Planctomycetota bacterium]
MTARLYQRRKAGPIRAMIVCALVAASLLYACRDRTVTIEHYNVIDRPARIQPDHAGSVIPPNIAPLNFIIKEQGSRYFVRITSRNGNPIEIFSKRPTISIPERAWRRLLGSNRDQQLSVDVFVKSKSVTPPSDPGRQSWSRYRTVTSRIADEDVDGFMVYRKIKPGHRTWRDMGVYQRDLGSFTESAILTNGYFKRGCVNCHAFCQNRTEKMLIGIRSANYGSSALLVEGNKVRKIGTKFGYTSWHPSGKVAAFSVNKVRQIFHSAAREVPDVIDLDSLMAYYLVESESVKTTPSLADKDRLETYPAWSADGRYLYFCSAPASWSDRTVIPESYDQIKYDLVRAGYDIDHDQWGPVESVLSAEDTGLSILLPRISPDGRWLLFCMCDYGCFPVYRRSSDLYITDLEAAEQTGEFDCERLDINSGESESWHCWSSNSRWIAFSSKRGSGVFTRIYIAYVDENGKVYKPIRLPQKDPAHYDSCLWTYSVPEFVTEPVRATGERLGKVVRSPQKISVEMPVTMATPKAGERPEYGQPWQIERE